MGGFLVIGKPLPRVDGVEKVTGAAVYSIDVSRPDMLCGKVARSAVPHGRIIRIDTTRAARVPGVAAILTGADIPPVCLGQVIFDQPPLACDVVRFVGEKVVAIAAESPDAAEEAIDLVEVEYEELPAVFDPEEAVRPEAPVLHPDFHSYRGVPGLLPDLPNVHGHEVLAKGDLAVGFAMADRIYEHAFRTPMIHQMYLEPHVCVAEIDTDDRLQFWTASKAPFWTRRQLSSSLGIPEPRIVVHNGPIGGDFGAKCALIDQPVAYFLARTTGRPVKMIMDSVEEFHAGQPRHTALVTLRTGVTREGIICARQATIYWGAGAYAGFKPWAGATLPGAKRALGPYRIPHTRIESFYVYTNLVPCGHMRAPGGIQVTFAGESQIDIIAQDIGLDPVEFRLRNGMEEGDFSPAGERYRGIAMKETLHRAIGAYRDPTVSSPPPGPSTLRGVGVACCERNVGGGRTSQRVEVQADGSVQIITGATDPGNGTFTMLRQVVAEVFQVSPERVRLSILDTDAAPWDLGTGASRVTHMVGSAAVRASERLKRRLAEVASDLLEAPSEVVDLTPCGFAVREQPARAVSLAEAAQELIRREGGPAADAFDSEGAVPPEHTFAAHVAEVDVDAETGQITLRRLVCAHDVGIVLNPLLASSQVEGGAIQGVGFALTEELRSERGRIVNGNFAEYKIPTIQDIPPRLDVVFVEGSTSEQTPFGAKAVGEICIMPAPAAVANAVAAAIGDHIFDLPITSEKVRSALRASVATSAGNRSSRPA